MGAEYAAAGRNEAGPMAQRLNLAAKRQKSIFEYLFFCLYALSLLPYV